ncbi:hypothetical protein KR074_006873, partial [Drosophila pseudoananassae]
NLKKSWHPNTMKNQERVWKAEEQAKMEEQKLHDLRKEINEERDREELKRLGESSGVLSGSGGAAGEAKLEWMYKNSTELINREEYLLGRKIEKSFETLQAEERRQEQNVIGVKQSINHVEHECVPFSIRQYRNLQSNEQVDLQRKTLEDPLMLIKQREMESRRKLLENPVKLKEIHRILKTEQDLKVANEKQKSKKSKKSKKKKKKSRNSSDDGDSSSDSNSDEDLDRKLARQVSKLKGDSHNSELKLEKLLDAKYRTISKQLDMATKKKKTQKSKRKSGHSSEESNIESEEQKKSRKRSRDSPPRPRRSRSPASRYQQQRRKGKSRSHEDKNALRRSRSPQESRKRDRNFEKSSESRRSPEKRRERRRSPEERRTRRSKSTDGRTNISFHRERYRSRSPENRSTSTSSPQLYCTRQQPQSRNRDPPFKRPSPPGRHGGKPKLTQADRDARLREMMDNATWREADRSQAVRKHREAYAQEEAQHQEREFDKEFINKEVKKAIANQNSIGDRIRANLNNIQRTASSMNTNFARK